MQRKRSTSISQRKKSKKKTLPQKKKPCLYCFKDSHFPILIRKSLYTKHQIGHFTQLSLIQKCMKEAKGVDLQKQNLERYFKSTHRKHVFPQVKQVYKLHHEAPKLYLPGIRQIITKCYHRKRLLDYFKMAKILGIRVDTIKFSTFILSLSKSRNVLNARKEPYDPLIGKISGYQFSQDVERQLIETLSGNENHYNAFNPEVEKPFTVKQITKPRPKNNFKSLRLQI